MSDYLGKTVMKQAGVYAIVSPSGRLYVGSSAEIGTRWRWHRNALLRGSHHNTALQAAFRKYSDKLQYVVLEFCPVESLIEREQAHVDSYEFERLYNSARDVETPTRGRKLTAEHRAKIAAKAMGRQHAPEIRAKMGKSRKGVPLSREHRAKMRNARLGRARSDIPVGASGLRFVYFVSGRWLAKVRNGTKRVHLGYYTTPEQAATMRDLYLAWRGPVTRAAA